MSWLNKESMEKWFDLLPEDVASCMSKQDLKPTDQDNEIVRDLENLKNGQEILNYVLSKTSTFADFGRPKRIRFLAWMSARDYPDIVQAIQLLTEEGSTGGSADGTEKIAPLFMADIRALVEALGPRVAHSIVDASTLGIVKGAGFEVASEFEMKSGGGI